MFSLNDENKVKEYSAKNPAFRIDFYGDALCLESSKKILRTVEEIIDEFGLKTLYLLMTDNTVVKCAFIEFNTRVYLFYSRLDTSAPISYVDIANAAISLSSPLPASPILNAQIYETEQELQWASTLKAIEHIEEQIALKEKFLSDPWKEYKTKVTTFRKRLDKLKAMTKDKIKTETKALEDLKKKKETLKDETVNKWLLGK